MNDFIPISKPPPPGRYWTAQIRKDPPDSHGVVNVHIRNLCWRKFDGREWSGGSDDQPTHWHGDVTKVAVIQQ